MTGSWAGQGYGRRAGAAGLALAATGLLLAGSGERAASGAGDIVARMGPLTVTATALRPGPAGALIASLQLRTSGQRSDQLDAVLAAGGGTVALYHEQVSLAEVPDLTGCGGDAASLPVVEHWLHYGPLPVTGRSAGPAPPVDATLTVQPVTQVASTTLTVTLYFANGGVLPLTLPVNRSGGPGSLRAESQPNLRQEAPSREGAKRDATLLALKLQEDCGIDVVTDGEQSRQHFVHGFVEFVDGIDFAHKVEIGIRADRYMAVVPQVTCTWRRSRTGASKRCTARSRGSAVPPRSISATAMASRPISTGRRRSAANGASTRRSFQYWREAASARSRSSAAIRACRCAGTLPTASSPRSHRARHSHG